MRSSSRSRAIDAHAGRVILMTLGLFKRRRIAPLEVRKVGLCTFGAIGDAIITSAIIPDIIQRYPNAQVTLIVSETNRSVASVLRHLGGIFVLPLFHPATALRMLRKQHFDVLIDANQWLRISAVYCALGGAKRCIGFRTPGQNRHYAYTDVVDHSADRHELDNFRALLGPLGIRGTHLPEVRVGEPIRAQVLAQLPAGPVVALHAWAGGSNAELKQWPDHCWVELASLLAEKGFVPVLTGAPSDAAQAQRLVALAHAKGVEIRSLAGRLDLSQTAALLTKARFLVSVNTGILHLAAALGTPVIGLHGPTDPRRWGPLGPRSVAILPVAPSGVPTAYLNLGFEFPPHVPPCMPYISVMQVIQAIKDQELLNKATCLHTTPRIAQEGVP